MSDLANQYSAPRVCRQTQEQATTSTTLTDSSGLVFSVNANRVYAYRFLALYSTAIATCGIRFGVKMPGFVRSAAIGRTTAGADGASCEQQALLNSSSDAYSATEVQVANTTHLLIIDGAIVTNADGSINLAFGSETGVNEVRLLAGSCGMLWDLGP